VFAPVLSAHASAPTTAESVQPDLYLTPGAAWDAMYEDCSRAQHSICFEQYIIANDETGLRFLQLFTRKAQAGIKVQLVLDSIGSHDVEGSAALDALRNAGGEVIIFNPKQIFHLLFPATWLPRNHAKTLIVDSSIAYVGSVCLASYMRNWHDVHLRLSGPIVKSIVDDFTQLWGQLLNRKAHSRYSWLYPRFSMTGQAGGLRYMVHKPELRVNALYLDLLQHIATAQKRIVMVTPYFLPPLRLRVALQLARRRGVRVTVLVSDETDVPLADRVGRSYFPMLLDMGLELLLYKGTVMHAKYSIIDGTWATIGSTNLDYLSLLYNRETNLVVEDPSLIAALETQFRHDSKQAARATRKSWSRQSWLYRLIGRAGRFLRHMM